MNDASEAATAVLENQIATQEPLAPDELAHAVILDTEVNEDARLGSIRRIVARLAQTQAADALH